jgi:AraC family transcriptional regulator
MLTGSRILVTNASGELAPFTPFAPIRSSAGLGWQGIHLEEHATPPTELTSTAPHEDLVWLQLSPLVDREMRHNGDWQALRTPAGTIGVRPRGVVHDGRWHSEVRAVVVAMHAALLDNAAESLGVRRPGLALATGVDSAARHLILALRDEVESGGAGGLLFAESIGMGLAIHLLRRYAAESPVRADRTGQLSTPQLRAALDFITAHLGDNPSLAQVAAATALSPYHFARRFKSSLGLSPHQFMVRARVERAKTLLADARHSLVEVGLATGFANQSHFTTAFRRVVGMTPKRYRDRL